MQRLLGALLASAIATAAFGQSRPGAAIDEAMRPMVVREAASNRTVVTRHRIVVNGRTLSYRAVVGETTLTGRNGTPAAVAVTYAYLADQPAGARPRPVLFAFNGGPGASSSPLHLHGIGPRRRTGDRIVDNASSPLDVADLVFVDPVGTGASMPIRGGEPDGFFGTQGDARAMIEVIARWKVANDRTDAPTLLLGESYGTYRAAAMLAEDAAAQRLKVRGVILLSLVTGNAGRDVVSPVTALPTLAAIAWYHGRVEREHRSVAQQYNAAVSFAQTDYAAALIKGASLPSADRRRIAQQMSALIGLPAAALERSGLMVEPDTFMATLLGDGRRTGNLDGRVTRATAASDYPAPYDDPSMTMGVEPVDPIVPYLECELRYVPASPYRALNLGINRRWNYGDGFQGWFDVRPALQAALAADPALRVMLMGGYFDLSTPAYAARFALDHAGIPDTQRVDRLYPTGHSILEDDAVLARAGEDIRAFVRTTAATGAGSS